MFGSSYFTVATGNNAITYVGMGESAATENKVSIPSPFSGTVSGFRIRTNVGPDSGGGTQSYTFTLRVAGSSTSLTCTIAEAATACNNLVNSAAINAGDPVSVQVQESGAGTPTAVSVTWSFLVQ